MSKVLQGWLDRLPHTGYVCCGNNTLHVSYTSQIYVRGCMQQPGMSTWPTIYRHRKSGERWNMLPAFQLFAMLLQSWECCGFAL